ncbi:Rie1p NDAI_0B00930 [Naumovozyma dairenensis CBS 421]|uniref:RRM domain-containing protein n=1 Tax=Naumovozyma dairenensis (strain ATCC 10597 / BCRC 20456 / CBS 421 / NBRC 0211 / NRRL Y-12639) TaxID=1071378 RepID=G0W5R6_NAUDC|nr:hypothetical protein NDAI_0B00930 [Naumovozyma dairenensis CBS 421]CCD23127.1 hypothetical protein NDAI_0B00930 [Naumovozyma dairenensis CBS 421]
MASKIKTKSDHKRSNNNNKDGPTTGHSTTSTQFSNVLPLEQLANTNTLTIRLKWEDNNVRYDIDQQLKDLLLKNHGYIIPLNEIESYQYLNDTKRLETLQEFKDIYKFENGNEEIQKFTRIGKDKIEQEEKHEEDEQFFYNLVLQAQLHNETNLTKACEAVQSLLSKDDHDSVKELIQWSISWNKRALTHPNNLFIGGVNKNMTLENMTDYLCKYGHISSLKLLQNENNSKNNKSNNDSEILSNTGYGFVSFQLGSQASNCINELNGKLFKGSKLFLNYHVERKERERIQWNQLRENNDDGKFKCIFIGNFPINNMKQESGETENKDKSITNEFNYRITPEIIIEKIKSELLPLIPDFEILSYYFPRIQNNHDVTYIKNQSTVNAKVFESDNVNDLTKSGTENALPLKGYGFINVLNHEQALQIIAKFNNYEWNGSRLIVNKAVQNSIHEGTSHNSHSFTIHGNSSHNATSKKQEGDDAYNITRSSISSSSRHASLSGLSNNNSKPFIPRNRSYNNSQYYKNNNSNPYAFQPNYPISPPTTNLLPMAPPFSPNANGYTYAYPLPIGGPRNDSFDNGGLSPLLDNLTVGGVVPPPPPPPPLALSPIPQPNMMGPGISVPSLISKASPTVYVPTSSSSALSKRNKDKKGEIDEEDDDLDERSQNDYPINPMFYFNNFGYGYMPNYTYNYGYNNTYNPNTAGSSNLGYSRDYNIVPGFDGINEKINNNGKLPIPLYFQQESNLYVKYLPLDWDDDDLYDFFVQYGNIISAKVITVGGSKNKTQQKDRGDDKELKEREEDEDNDSSTIKSEDELGQHEEDKDEDINGADEAKEKIGISKGYGFVCFENPLDASQAILGTDGVAVTPTNILGVTFAQKRHHHARDNSSASNNNNMKWNDHGNEIRYNRKFMNAVIEQQQQQQQNGSTARPNNHWSYRISTTHPLN